MGIEPISKDGITGVVTKTVEMEMLILEQEQKIWQGRCWSGNSGNESASVGAETGKMETASIKHGLGI